MKTRTHVRLWVAQRVSAMVLGVCVVVHLVTIMVVMRGGVSAADILQRTQGSVAWLLFYVVFVIAVAVHASVGLRDILAEWLRWRGPWVDAMLLVLGVVLAMWGLRAVGAVFA